MPVEHGNRPATAWAGLTELTQRTSDFTNLLFGKGHFFSLLLGELADDTARRLRGDRNGTHRTQTLPHAWSDGAGPWKCASTDLCSRLLGRYVQLQLEALLPIPAGSAEAAPMPPSPQPGPQARGPRSDTSTGSRLVGEDGSFAQGRLFLGQAPCILMSWEPPKKVRFDTKKLATRDGTRNRGDAVSDGRRRSHLPCAFLV